MSQKKSTKKLRVTLIRFKDGDTLQLVRDAAALDDVSMNKFMVRSVVAAAKEKLKASSVTR